MSTQDLYGPNEGPGYKLDWAYLQYLAKECKWAYEELHDLEAAGVEVRVSEDNYENIVFAFRGTTFNGADIIKDLRTVPWYSRELQGWYHKGFLTGARAIVPLIIEELAKHDTGPYRPDIRYILVGHSKGGAEATIVAALMVGLGRPPCALVTYGAPYAGDDSLRRWLLDVDGHRVVNGADPVAVVPWFLARLGVFSHHRGETTVRSGLNNEWPDPRNHKIGRYIDALGYTPHG